MKSFFNRHEEDIEDFVEEDDDLDIINLDETAGWSKLEVAEELARQQAANLIEEIGDELAIIDAVEEDTVIEDLGMTAPIAVGNYAASKKVMPASELEELDDAEPEIEEFQDDDIEIEHLQDEDVEYISEEEYEEDDDEYEYESPFAFFENLGEWLSHWTVMDKVVAVTGVLVLAMAILTVGVYAGNRGVNKQIEAFAPIGEQLETIGIVGQDKLVAVADAKKAMLEAAKLEAELNQEYEENELSSEVKVIMKMTTVHKDLKIKFVNKKTGKLIGNVPFEVKIVDADGKSYNKIDEDEDGIIYLTDITPGNYSVSMVELDDSEGYSFSTSAEKIKVKDKIAYEKIDVSDEIKDQSEVDVSKEDTAQKLETESTLTDTVEWVASTKKEVNAEESYTKVSKDTIAEPSLSASLNFDLNILNVMPQVRFPSEEIHVMDEASSVSDNTVEENSGVTGIALEATSITLEMGKTRTLSVVVFADEGADKTVKWSSTNEAVAVVNEGIITAKAEGETTIIAKAGDKTASCVVTVTAKEEIIPVSEIVLNRTSMQLRVNETENLKATIKPDNAAKKVIWKSSDDRIATVGNDGKVKAIGAGTVTITASAGDKSASCEVVVVSETEENQGIEIYLKETEIELKINDSKTLTVVVKADDVKDRAILWKTADERIAVVDSTGKVSAKAVGETTITATVEGKTAVCKVKVLKTDNPKEDTSKSLKDKSGNQMYILKDGKYIEAKVADYWKYDTFYKKEKVSQYVYTGWQNIDGKTYFFDKNGNKVTGEQVIQGARYNFNSDGSLNTGSGILGIDVSTWNGNIDWNKVKNSGVSYVIIRTGFRGSTQGSLVEDNKFRQNIQGATNAGLKVGVYFFSQAINEVEAVEEASMVLSQVKGYNLAYPVFIDVEPSGGRADALSSGDRTKVINAFCQTIQNGGYKVGIYANKTWLAQKMNISALSGYKIWLAQYNSTVTYGGRYDMWQYSDKGTVAGINGQVDMNLSYLSY